MEVQLNTGFLGSVIKIRGLWLRALVHAGLEARDVKLLLECAICTFQTVKSTNVDQAYSYRTVQTLKQ